MLEYDISKLLYDKACIHSVKFLNTINNSIKFLNIEISCISACSLFHYFALVSYVSSFEVVTQAYTSMCVCISVD